MIYLIIGEKNVGKTKYLKNMIRMLKNADGYLQIKQFENKRFIGYNIERVLTGEKVPFIRFDRSNVSKNNILLEYKNMVFLKEGFNFFKRIFFEAKKQHYQNFLIDGVGKLEIKEKIFSEILKGALESFENIYITVRTEHVDEFIKKFKITNYEKIILVKETGNKTEHTQNCLPKKSTQNKRKNKDN